MACSSAVSIITNLRQVLLPPEAVAFAAKICSHVHGVFIFEDLAVFNF